MTECPNCGEYKLSHRVCKTVVLTMVKKSFLNNLYLFKKVEYEFIMNSIPLFLYYLNLYHCYQNNLETIMEQITSTQNNKIKLANKLKKKKNAIKQD